VALRLYKQKLLEAGHIKSHGQIGGENWPKLKRKENKPEGLSKTSYTEYYFVPWYCGPGDCLPSAVGMAGTEAGVPILLASALQQRCVRTAAIDGGGRQSLEDARQSATPYSGWVGVPNPYPTNHNFLV
jgi:hypothetical protein